MTRPSDEGRCDLCGEPMPEGESMFRMHGYSGPCPKPPLPIDGGNDVAIGVALQSENAALRAELAAVKAIAAEQALDEGLWCIAETAMEGYLQAALRRLAAAVEGDAIAGGKT